MDRVLDWLASLPTAALYAAMAVVAAVENIFPPIPADTIVAFGSFLAARGQGTLLGAFLATWLGNVAGALVMYQAGRMIGAERIERRLLGERGPGAEARLAALYGKYGLLALFLSRFLPGIRAIVPPFAGALKLPLLSAGLVIAAASGIWYGFVSVLAFRIGNDWPRVVELMGGYGRIAALVAGAIALVAGIVWWRRTRRQRS